MHKRKGIQKLMSSYKYSIAENGTVNLIMSVWHCQTNFRSVWRYFLYFETEPENIEIMTISDVSKSLDTAVVEITVDSAVAVDIQAVASAVISAVVAPVVARVVAKVFAVLVFAVVVVMVDVVIDVVVKVDNDVVVAPEVIVSLLVLVVVSISPVVVAPVAWAVELSSLVSI